MYRKRERTQNWTLEEKKYLLELVKFRLDVLENKRIDSASSALKGIAWQDIHASFAARWVDFYLASVSQKHSVPLQTTDTMTAEATSSPFCVRSPHLPARTLNHPQPTASP